jgi:hypothetical protein
MKQHVIFWLFTLKGIVNNTLIEKQHKQCTSLSKEFSVLYISALCDAIVAVCF